MLLFYFFYYYYLNNKSITSSISSEAKTAPEFNMSSISSLFFLPLNLFVTAYHNGVWS